MPDEPKVSPGAPVQQEPVAKAPSGGCKGDASGGREVSHQPRARAQRDHRMAGCESDLTEFGYKTNGFWLGDPSARERPGRVFAVTTRQKKPPSRGGSQAGAFPSERQRLASGVSHPIVLIGDHRHPE